MSEPSDQYQHALELLTGSKANEGLALLEALAAEGHIESMIQAATCYFKGLGSEKNLYMAASYLEQAAKAGSEIATELYKIVCELGVIEVDHVYWKNYGA